MPQRALLKGLGLSPAAAAAAVQCSNATSSSGSSKDVGQMSAAERISHYPLLNWAHDASLIQLQPAGPSGVIELNSITLLGLSQGPGVSSHTEEGGGLVGRRLAAAAADSSGRWWCVGCSSRGGVGKLLGGTNLHLQQQQQQQQGEEYSRAPSRSLAAAQQPPGSSSKGSGTLTQADVRVWTHVVWGIKRAGGGQLVARSIAMALPQPEFQRLLAASRGSPGGAFSIPLEGVCVRVSYVHVSLLCVNVVRS
jgi:hypothetical protein